MTAYDPSEWSEFFLAAAGAAAALAGLVFVAISINIDRILSLRGVAERALETVLALLGVVLASLIVLMPALSETALGILLLVQALLLIGVAAQVNRQGAGPKQGEEHLSRHLMWTLASVPVLIGGISLLVEAGGGLYWIGAGVLLGILSGVMNAWVLLVEILR